MDIRFVTKIYPKENSPYERSKFCLCAYTIEILQERILKEIIALIRFSTSGTSAP